MLNNMNFFIFFNKGDVYSAFCFRDISKIDVVQRVKQKSMMEHSIFDWSKVPNAQQKRQGDELTVTSQIITQFR